MTATQPALIIWAVNDSAHALPDAESRPWLTVPEGGRLGFGLGRSASYEAARRGDLPTVRVGRRIVVPTAVLRRMLGLDATSTAR